MEQFTFGEYEHSGQTYQFTTAKRSTLVVGALQTGKTTLLTRLCLEDICSGEPVIYIDPNGAAVDEILKRIPKERQPDVLLIDPTRQPFALNVLASITPEQRDIFASTLLDTVKGVWGYENQATPVLDQYIRATLHTALAVSGTTFFSLKFLLTDDKYRTQLLKTIDDPVIKDFWSDFEKLKDRDRQQETASTLNKLRAFLFSPHVRDCLDQKTNALVFKDKIVLIALRTRELGTENAGLLAALILSLLYVTDDRQNLYIDGARFGTSILGQLLNSCPNVTTVLAVQFLDQLRAEFLPALLGGIGQIVAFRTSHKDSRVLGPAFNLKSGHIQLSELGAHRAYLCIDGSHHLLTMYPHSYPETHQARKIRARCLSQCTAPRKDIENRIARFM